MNNLERLYFDNINTIYGINNNLVIIPNNLKENINVYLAFNNNLNINIDDLLNSIKLYKTDINVNDSNSILFLYNVNSKEFNTNLKNIKTLVNNVYNVMLKSRKFTRKSFVRNIKVVKDSNNKMLINWLCSSYSRKFSMVNNYGVAEIVTSINNGQSHINNGSVDFTSRNESLSIGNVPVQYHVDRTNIPNNQSFNINRNSGFIKWSSIILILGISVIIGISLSLYLLK